MTSVVPQKMPKTVPGFSRGGTASYLKKDAVAEALKLFVACVGTTEVVP
jgi:hypothetical protein